MEELFKGMLPIALQSGLSVFDFWSMTYGELSDTIDAYNNNETNRVKESASLNYNLANLIGFSVARLMDKKAKYPTLQDAYPGLFDDLKVEDKQPVQQDWENAKPRMMKYTEAHNKKRGDK